MRGVRAGSIQSAVRDAMTAAGGLECTSIDLGVSVATLSYGTSVDEARPGGLGVNYLDRLGRMHCAAALPLAQHFAMLAGGVYQPLQISGDTATDIHTVTREFSDVLASHAEAHSSASDNPDDYTVQEASAMIKEVDELIAAAARLKAALLPKAGA
ncbi:hypothetical protein [Celeribacter sp.]|uniref:hypothetical protein n=1 Tax=Celeribacter sp. TaxID=1890673 RepID=UPI003A94F580